MTNLLFVSSDIAPSPAKSRLAACYASIYSRDRTLDLESYYQSVLGYLTRHKSEAPETHVTLVEPGLRLKDGAGQEPGSALLVTDIVGLMLQPFCRTEDQQGRVQFTDVAQLFAPERLDSAQKVLEEKGVAVHRGTAAAVAAPELLTAAERRVLVEMGAETAVTYLYLEARAARAHRLPALGLVLPVNDEIEETWIEILCRLADSP